MTTTNSGEFDLGKNPSAWSSLTLAEAADAGKLSKPQAEKPQPERAPVQPGTDGEGERARFQSAGQYGFKYNDVPEPARNRKPAPVRRKTGEELERADYEAARLLGLKRGEEAAAAKKGGAAQHKVKGWLVEEPIRWSGRKVRSRRNGSIFTIRQVFKGGRVELQKNFMLFCVDVEDVRKDYEPA